MLYSVYYCINKQWYDDKWRVERLRQQTQTDIFLCRKQQWSKTKWCLFLDYMWQKLQNLFKGQGHKYVKGYSGAEWGSDAALPVGSSGKALDHGTGGKILMTFYWHSHKSLHSNYQYSTWMHFCRHQAVLGPHVVHFCMWLVVTALGVKVFDKARHWLHRFIDAVSRISTRCLYVPSVSGENSPQLESVNQLWCLQCTYKCNLHV